MIIKKSKNATLFCLLLKTSVQNWKIKKAKSQKMEKSFEFIDKSEVKKNQSITGI
jgi:hypothetical protein